MKLQPEPNTQLIIACLVGARLEEILDTCAAAWALGKGVEVGGRKCFRMVVIAANIGDLIQLETLNEKLHVLT